MQCSPISKCILTFTNLKHTMKFAAVVVALFSAYAMAVKISVREMDNGAAQLSGQEAIEANYFTGFKGFHG